MIRRWMVQWAVLLLLTETTAFRIYSPRRIHLPALEMNCYEVPMKSLVIPVKNEANRQSQKIQVAAPTSLVPVGLTPAGLNLQLNTHEIVKRFDHLFPEGDDIVKEHAKLVQDINSLRQVVFVAPLVDDNRDYDDSVFHEIIETSTSTTARPTTAAAYPSKSKKAGGIPVLLLGGASQRQSVRAAPAVRATRPSISLVGSSITPLVRHPYPFVGQASSPKPYKVCMPVPMQSYPTTTRRPTLWSKLLSFFPRLTG